MYTFNEILEKIEHEVRNLEFVYPPKSLYEPVEYILSLGGKRIRPALVLMAYNIYKDDVEQAIRPAIGLEVFHNFTLLHDDLMDQADKRRNKPTVHKVWNANTAILSGDAMLIAAYKLMAETPGACLKEVLDLFTQTAAEICGGQQYDMEFETRDDVKEEEYIEMIRLKTAVLLACSLKVGAILADAPKEDAENLYQFGINIGLSFQLQDDYLDVYGDTAEFGKKIGGDILCNKKTYLLIKAQELASGEDKALLHDWMQRKDYDPVEKIRAVTEIYNRAGVPEAVQEKIEYYVEKSRAALDKVEVPEERKVYFREIIDAIGDRKK